MERVTPVADLRARRFERSVQGDHPYEHAALIANATGQVLFRKRGTRQSVAFSVQELELMPENVLSHNHPDGWHYPVDDPRPDGAGFSIDDVRVMIEWGLAEIRAVTPRYLHRLRPSQVPDSVFNRTVSGLPSQTLNAALRQVFAQTQYALIERVASGSMSKEKAIATLSHESLLRLMQDWGVEYEREEIP